VPAELAGDEPAKAKIKRKNLSTTVPEDIEAQVRELRDTAASRSQLCSPYSSQMAW
jgi:hypothetical protein